MAGELTPEVALEYLTELSADVRAGIVLGPGGRRLAGDRSLEAPARALLAANEASEIEVLTERGAVFAIRDREVAIVVVARRSALPPLMLHDMRMALHDLDGGAG